MNRLLISTMLKLVFWDGEPYIFHEGDLSKGDAHYNGITWNENTLFVSAAIDTKYVIRAFDKHLNPMGILPDADLHETHQIYWRQGKLYVTNTGLNRIEILENNKWDFRCWVHTTYDIDHINGIWADQDYIYISEFANRGAAKKPSQIRIVEPETFVSITEIPIGPGIHNVYSESGKIYTLISSPPRIAQYDLIRGGCDFINLPIDEGLVRGLARTKDYWYIGVSRWETERDKRHVGDTIVLQLDNDFKEKGRLMLPHFGPVCDIRVVGEPDYAHNGVAW